MRRPSQRELRRMQERMLSNLGLSMEELGRASHVTIELEGRTIRISGPSVVVINSQAGRIYQIVGGEEAEEAERVEGKTVYEPSPEDIALVAAQAGVQPEVAKAALIESEGDLARAIISLKTRKA